MTSGISDSLRPYLPTSLFQADGSLKAGVTTEQATEVAKGIQAKADALPPAQAKLFLAMVGGADLAPDGKLPTDLDAALAKFAGAAAQIASLAISSNALDFLARAMIEQSAEQRKSALNDRLQAREQAKGELLTQAGMMREEADKLSSSSLSSMIVSVVMASISIAAGALSAGLSVAGAFSGASAASKVMNAPEKAADAAAGATSTTTGAATQATSKTAETFERLNAAGQAAAGDKGAKIANAFAGFSGTVSQTSGQLGGSISNFISTTGQSEAKDLEADGQVAAAQAQEQQAIGDLRKEQQQALDQMVQAIIQFLKDLKEAKAEQMRAFTRV